MLQQFILMEESTLVVKVHLIPEMGNRLCCRLDHYNTGILHSLRWHRTLPRIWFHNIQYRVINKWNKQQQNKQHLDYEITLNSSTLNYSWLCLVPLLLSKEHQQLCTLNALAITTMYYYILVVLNQVALAKVILS